jgi:hypothetical protein
MLVSDGLFNDILSTASLGYILVVSNHVVTEDSDLFKNKVKVNG